MGTRIHLVGIVALVALSACSTDTESTPTTAPPDTTAAATTDPPDTTAPDTTAPDTTAPDTTAPDTTAPADERVPTTADCAGLDSRACLLPWPNVAFTVADGSTPTGRRLALPSDAMPRNTDGIPIGVTDQNRADGFSPGSSVLLDLPGVDIDESALAPSTDIGSSLDPLAPIVIIDLDTGDRVPYWAELDAQATGDGDRLLIVRPAVSLVEGHEHLVAVRNLRDADGSTIEYPDQWTGSDDMDSLSSLLADHDVADAEMAWTFPVASADSLAGRALSMREQTDEALGDGSPTFTVTATTDGPAGVRLVEGTYAVPNFLSDTGAPGATLLLDADGGPMRNPDQPDYPAAFSCAVSTTAALPTVVYGHGLLGSRQEGMSLATLTALGQANICATDWIGMSTDDIGNVATILDELSLFPQQADRMVQGLVNFHVLGRLVNTTDGFVSAPEFQLADGSPALSPDGAVFVGNSQGGILGGAASAITNEWDRVVLGVPGINYSLLLTRSSNWPRFQTVFDTAYTTPVDRLLALELIQLLWDRGENQGYVQHLVDDTYDGITPKSVLMVQAFGDHQVANVSTEVLARTLDAVSQSPALGEGRSPDVEPFWGIDPIEGTVTDGAVVALWDFGTPAPPPVNLPPTEPEFGEDPHGAGSDETRVIEQAFAWLLAETYVPCDGPCVSDVLSR
jgi:hypothetical protein